jgi:hypothetical protein
VTLFIIVTSVSTEVAEIAKKHLNIETLETRKSDSLDFHDVAVWALKDALQEAYGDGLREKR